MTALITILFDTPIFTGNIQIYLWHILLSIWIIGSLLYVLNLYRHYLYFKRIKNYMLHLYDVKSSNFQIILEDLQKQHKQPRKIQVIQNQYVGTPVIFGFRQPVILLPDYPYTDSEIRYIFTHELEHLYHYDYIWKLFFELLTAVYWWNPFIWILKHQLNNMLELNADKTVIKTLNDSEKVAYLECLYSTHANQLSRLKNSNLLLTFDSNTSSLLQRAHYITKSSNKTSIWITLIICTVLSLSSTLFSISPVFPTPEEIENTTFNTFSNDTYFVKIEDNLYEMYMNNTLIGTLTNPYTDEFKNFPIYEKER